MQTGFGLTLEATHGAARAGTLVTWHGSVPTPLFMPVATLATVKGVDIGRVAETGAGMILANTYHLHLRPGEEIVAEGGGLARFMGWNGPTLTDSGGFQVFSLAKQVKVTEEGAFFRSHLDGSAIDLTPERAIHIQERLGADVAMQLDEVVALPADRDRVDRTQGWALQGLVYAPSASTAPGAIALDAAALARARDQVPRSVLAPIPAGADPVVAQVQALLRCTQVQRIDDPLLVSSCNAP
jgi:tRNA-guanine family transglycosylase